MVCFQYLLTVTVLNRPNSATTPFSQNCLEQADATDIAVGFALVSALLGLLYSHRKATIGSTRAAERAGINVAISATAISTTVTAAKLKGSRDPTS